MCCVLLKFFDELCRRRAEYIVNLMDLIKFVVAGEEREQRQNFEEDAADTPDVHFVAIVTVCHEAFWRSIPSGRNVFCQWRFTVEASTAAKVC